MAGRFRIQVAIAVFLVVGLVLGATSRASAQDGLDTVLQSLPGLDAAYARKYLSAYSMGFATPVSDNSAIPSVVTVTVLQFKSESSATNAFELAMNDRTVGMVLGDADARILSKGVDDLGDRARLFHIVRGNSSDREADVTQVLAVQDGNLGFLITGQGTPESLAATLPAIAAFMVETEPGDTPVEVNSEGVLAGGVADLLLGPEDGILPEDLIPVYDYDLLNVGQSPIQAPATPAP